MEKLIKISDESILEFVNFAVIDHKGNVNPVAEEFDLDDEDKQEVADFIKKTKGLVKFTGKFFDHKEDEELDIYWGKVGGKWKYMYNAYPGGDGTLVVLSNIEIDGAEGVYGTYREKVLENDKPKKVDRYYIQQLKDYTEIYKKYINSKKERIKYPDHWKSVVSSLKMSMESYLEKGGKKSDDLYKKADLVFGTKLKNGGGVGKKPKMVRTIFEDEEYEYGNGANVENGVRTIAEESILKKVRKYHKDGLLEITRSGILGNDFKTKDDRVIVKDSGNKVGGFNAYKIIVDGKEIEGLFTLSQSYKFIVDFIENKYAKGGGVGTTFKYEIGGL